ncbi:MAG: ABC transporter ATP-binding protein [Sedimentisphaerales bacterium]|nr:ABC transporter ATP-binding protein [Sedimentisphaerales bacterium]
MKALRRVLPYIWPQWPRLVVILSSALFNSILFSTTVASIIPVLTIMMGQEGLHGWVDRVLTTQQYGMKFYVASKEDLALDPNMNYHLRIVEAKAKGAAATAGIAVSDAIVAVRSPADANISPMPTADMLARLASTPANSEVAVDIKHAGATTSKRVMLVSDKRPLYANYALKAVSIMPRNQGQKSREQAVLFLMVVLTSVTFLRCFCRFLQDYIGDKVVQNSLAQLREHTYGHVLNMPVGFFVREGGTETVSKMVQDTGTIGGGLKTMLTKAIREPLMALSMMAWAFWLSPKLTLVFLCAAPMLVIAVSNLGRKIKRATKRSLQNWAKVLGKLAESITAIKVVKIYNRQDYEYARFTEINRKQLKHQLRIAKTDAATDPMMEALGMIALGGGIVYGAHWAMAGGNADTTTFFGVLFLLGASAEAIRRTSDVWNRLNQSNAAAERVFALIDQPEEQQRPTVGELKQFKNTIEFKNVRFTYPGTERQVLKGINLTVRTGQNVAVVGPNGSGKTTLVNLLPRFYDVDGGGVFIDGVDIRDVTLASLRNQMAMVTQNVITFNDTIAANIAYGKPGATIEEITEAAKRAYAHEFIAPLPDGYDSIIGEQGSGLSGGQLQRIVIARAILKNPPIMIFDEAMSQIDADSEAKIHRALDEFMKNRTAFVIAHRFSTVINAHKIVVMNDGQVIAEGVHSELVKTCPLYQNLYQTQLLKD